MTHTLVTAAATVLAVIAALEHLPVALTRLVRSCGPLIQAWREVRRTGQSNCSSPQTEDRSDPDASAVGDTRD